MSKINDIKKLSPEERIKRLKHLEHETHREMQEAKRQIEIAQQEMKTETETLRKIPIPQVKSIDVTTLFGGDDKLIWKNAQFKSDSKEEPSEPKALESKILEESIIQNQEMKQKIASASGQYKTVSNFYDEVKAMSVYQNINEDQRDRLMSIYYKLNDAKEVISEMQQQNPGKYSDANESMEEMLDNTKKMLKNMMGMYWKGK